VSDHASIVWPVIQFLGAWLGTVKRERREADRKLVAGCYLCDRGRNVNPDAGINPQSGSGRHWVIVALVAALNGIAIEGLPSRNLRRCAHGARGCKALTRPTLKAIADAATFSAQQWLYFAKPVTLKAARSFASHPAGLRLPRARLCAALPSPPFFFVFPRCVRVPSSVARPGLDGNSA
jgi:hypothetical protein